MPATKIETTETIRSAICLHPTHYFRQWWIESKVCFFISSYYSQTWFRSWSSKGWGFK
jgi:hypothetical protein